MTRKKRKNNSPQIDMNTAKKAVNSVSNAFRVQLEILENNCVTLQ